MGCATSAMVLEQQIGLWLKRRKPLVVAPWLGEKKGTTKKYVEAHLGILQPKKGASWRSRKQEYSDCERSFIMQGSVDISNLVSFWICQNQNWFKPPMNEKYISMPKKPDFGSKLKVCILILAFLNFLISHTSVVQKQKNTVFIWSFWRSPKLKFQCKWLRL